MNSALKTATSNIQIIYDQWCSSIIRLVIILEPIWQGGIISDNEEAPYQTDHPISFITASEVRREVSVVKRKKSGCKGVDAKTIKCVLKKSILYLVPLFNTIFGILFDYFPIQSKSAETIIIYKPGKTENEAYSYESINH